MDILRAILLSLEAMIEDPELQVNGFVLIIDWSNFTFKQASKLTPSMLRLAIEGLQVTQLFDFNLIVIFIQRINMDITKAFFKFVPSCIFDSSMLQTMYYDIQYVMFVKRASGLNNIICLE